MEYLQSTTVNSTLQNSSLQLLNGTESRRFLITFMTHFNMITVIFLYTEMISCFVLNLTSLGFIWFISRQFTPINILISNLAIVDIMYASCVPFFVAQFEGRVLTQIECQMSYFLDVACMVVNVFTIAGLTLERYMFVKQKKIDQNDREKKRVFLLGLGILWLLAICFALIYSLFIKLVRHDDADQETCGSSMSARSQAVYTILKWLLTFVLPYSLIIIFSILLLLFLHKWSKKAKLMHGQSKHSKPNASQLAETSPSRSLVNTSTQSQVVDEQTKMITKKKKENANNSIAQMHMRIKRKSTRFVLAVVFSFLLCWFPFWSQQIFYLFTSYESIWLMIWNHVAIMIVYLQGVIDPLLFMLLTENFRNYLKKKLVILSKSK